jgi:hypothetical protein
VVGASCVKIVPGKPATVVVLPSPAEVACGATQGFTASVLDCGGNAISNPSVSWSVTKIGTLSAKAGTSTVFTAGETPCVAGTVTAISGGKKGTAAVTVAAPANVTVKLFVGRDEVLPQGLQVTAGGSKTFTAKAYYGAQKELKGVSFRYGKEGDIGDVNETKGAFTASKTAGGTGSIVVRALCGSSQIGDPWLFPIAIIPGPAKTVSVTPQDRLVQAGGTVTYTAAVVDIYDNPVTDLEVKWSAAPAKGGTLDPSSGNPTTFTAGATLGKCTVTAKCGAASGKASVTVVPAPPARVKLCPADLQTCLTTQDTYSAHAGTTVTCGAKAYGAQDAELTWKRPARTRQAARWMRPASSRSSRPIPALISAIPGDSRFR